MRARVTLADVARHAGVSASTVSRVMADHPSISPATRTRVRAVAEELGLVVNTEAKQLSTGRSETLGLVVPDLQDPFHADIVKGAQRYARANGYLLYVSNTNQEPALELEAVAELGTEVDGLLLCSPRASDADLVNALDALPAVILHRHIPGVPSVIVDLEIGMAQTASHLASLGHEHIAYASGPMQSWNAAQRRLAFERVIDGDVLGPRTDQFEGGFAAGDSTIASGATAVIAHNDAVALGILARLSARGLRVPQDISVVGCDNTELALVAPDLTSINVPRAEAAERAVRMLLDVVDGRHGHTDEVVVLPTQLMVRQTTGVAPAAGRRPGN